jgi:anti-sigma factor RsiW
MKCSEALPLLDLLYDERLETRDSAILLDHLKNCDQCRAEWDAMDNLRTRVAEAREKTFIPAELMDNVFVAVKNESQSNRFLGLLPQQIPLAAIAASILLLGWIVVPQLLNSNSGRQEIIATQKLSAQKLIADFTVTGTTTPEQDKLELDRRVGYSLKYVHLPSWKLQSSGVYSNQTKIARFDFIRDKNAAEQKLCCYQAPEGTIEVAGSPQEVGSKQVVFGDQSGFQYAKFTQNGRDYLFITRLPKADLEDIIRGA